MKLKTDGTALGAKMRFTGTPMRRSCIEVVKQSGRKCSEQTRAFLSCMGGLTSFKVASQAFKRGGSLTGRRWKLTPGQSLSVLLSHPNAMQYGMLVPIKEYSTWSRSLPTTYSDISAAKNMAARNYALITASSGNIFNTEQVMQIINPLFFIAHICLHFEVNMNFGFSALLNPSRDTDIIQLTCLNLCINKCCNNKPHLGLSAFCLVSKRLLKDSHSSDVTF